MNRTCNLVSLKHIAHCMVREICFETPPLMNWKNYSFHLLNWWRVNEDEGVAYLKNVVFPKYKSNSKAEILADVEFLLSQIEVKCVCREKHSHQYNERCTQLKEQVQLRSTFALLYELMVSISENIELCNFIAEIFINKVCHLRGLDFDFGKRVKYV